MVRFIISYFESAEAWTYRIYIPIWLDLLSFIPSLGSCSENNLHSNMVRFIIPFFLPEICKTNIFYILI